MPETAEARAPRSERDPVANVLLLVVLGLTLVLVVGALGTVLFLREYTGQPRTSVERDIATSERATSETPQDPNAWGKLVYAYIAAGRYADAQRAVDRGRAVRKAAVLDLAQADLYRTQGKLQQALAAYDVALASVNATYDRSEAAQAKSDVTFKAARSGVAQVLYGRALVRRDLGDTTGAIADLKKAVSISPAEVYLHNLLGDLLARADQSKAAEAQYRASLRYVPGNAEALAGLKRLGKGQ